MICSIIETEASKQNQKALEQIKKRVRANNIELRKALNLPVGVQETEDSLEQIKKRVRANSIELRMAMKSPGDKNNFITIITVSAPEGSLTQVVSRRYDEA